MYVLILLVTLVQNFSISWMWFDASKSLSKLHQSKLTQDHQRLLPIHVLPVSNKEEGIDQVVTSSPACESSNVSALLIAKY